MTHLWIIAACVAAASLGSLLFGTLTFALRDFSRAKLEAHLERTNQTDYLARTLDRDQDLAFVTGIVRQFCNILILIGVLRLAAYTDLRLSLQYLLAFLVTGLLTMFFSVALPHSIGRNAPEATIAYTLPLLHGLLAILSPVVAIMHLLDRLVSRIAGPDADTPSEQIEQEILSVVEEGEQQGIVDVQERQMIESVIEFRDTTAGEIMTPRPEIVAVDLTASLEEVKRTLESSGHSRIPVYERDLDHITGILYARDLLKYIGAPPGSFDIRADLRPPIYAPTSKTLRDLLTDFRSQKVHIAIVLDEYGGTAGLCTIEDVVEELVGEIADEHEPTEPASFKRIDDQTADVDARTTVDELNSLMGLSLPNDAGYETLGGFVSATVGRIPPAGTEFEHNNVRFTITDAEPQKVNRVKIHMLPVGSSRVDLQACKLEYSIVSPK